MYLVGVQLGSYLFFGGNSKQVLRSNRWAQIRVWILSLSFWYVLVAVLFCHLNIFWSNIIDLDFYLFWMPRSLTTILDRFVERVSCRMERCRYLINGPYYDNNSIHSKGVIVILNFKYKIIKINEKFSCSAMRLMLLLYWLKISRLFLFFLSSTNNICDMMVLYIIFKWAYFMVLLLLCCCWLVFSVPMIHCARLSAC